jgi:nitrate/nitrite transporter NarK
VFTAWGVGGFVLPRLQQMLQARSGNYTSSFVVAALLLLVGTALTFLLKPPQPKLAVAPA